jgi:hypothetical protein
MTATGSDCLYPETDWMRIRRVVKKRGHSIEEGKDSAQLLSSRREL